MMIVKHTAKTKAEHISFIICWSLSHDRAPQSFQKEHIRHKLARLSHYATQMAAHFSYFGAASLDYIPKKSLLVLHSL